MHILIGKFDCNRKREDFVSNVASSRRGEGAMAKLNNQFATAATDMAVLISCEEGLSGFSGPSGELA
jgi:hypothetical protein